MSDILTLVVQNPAYKTLNTANDKVVFARGFEAGYETATVQQDKKLRAYAAFINSSITRAELDEVLNEAE